MSSKSSIAHLSRFVSKDIPKNIPKKLESLYSFGIKAFTTQPLVSCNSNARIAHPGSRGAAEQQMYRLLRHPKLFLLVWRAVAHYSPLKETDLVNVDYSNLGPLAILGFAKQTRSGRAQPVLMRALASNTQGQRKAHPKYEKLKKAYIDWKKTLDANQFTFVIKSLHLLRYLYGCQPRLVFDRGFANKTIVQFLCDKQWTFYIRTRESFWVRVGGELVKAESLGNGSHQVKWAGRDVRLVVTKPRKRYTSPWYILTNDTTSSIETITKYYYFRFEIEESFRDIKTLCRLRHSRLHNWKSLRTVLVFMSLALIAALTDRKFRKVLKFEHARINSHKKLSIIRMWQEHISRYFLDKGFRLVIGDV